jgi:pimeloyl-ACP methyl ester carboxylesterase
MQGKRFLGAAAALLMLCLSTSALAEPPSLAELRERSSLGARLFDDEATKGNLVFFVRGFTGNEIDALPGIGYFTKAQSEVAKAGFGAKGSIMSEINTIGPMADLKKAIADDILSAKAQGKKAILVGHSRGGLAISRLLDEQPALREHVRGVILVDPALRVPGSKSPVVRNVGKAVLSVAPGGDPRAVTDDFYGEHELPSFATQVPTIEVYTRPTPGSPAWHAERGFNKAIGAGSKAPTDFFVKVVGIPGAHLYDLTDPAGNHGTDVVTMDGRAAALVDMVGALAKRVPIAGDRFHPRRSTMLPALVANVLEASPRKAVPPKPPTSPRPSRARAPIAPVKGR